MSNIDEVRSSKPWKCIERITTISSQWVTVYLERWKDSNDKALDYWRAERPDSVIVIPIHRERILLARSTYRVGVGDDLLSILDEDLPQALVRDDGEGTVEAGEIECLAGAHQCDGVAGNFLAQASSRNMLAAVKY